MTERRRWALVGGLGVVAVVVLVGGLLGAVGWLEALGWYSLAGVALLLITLDVI